MTEEQAFPPDQEPEPDAETAMLLIKRFDGSWVASNDLSINLTVARYSDSADVRDACQGLLDVANRNDLADEIVAKLAVILTPEPKTPASSISQALKERGIL
jgi:hypothetical protein